MADRSDIERILAANRYMVLGTADEAGQPWVTPVFFTPLGRDQLCWVSSPNTRHSRNIGQRAGIAITVYDSNVAVGRAEAAYFDANAARSKLDETDAALFALNARLPRSKRLSAADLLPDGPMAVYRADLLHSYLLVRGDNSEHGNVLDMTLEI